MHCPFCRHPDSREVDSRTTDDGTSIRRRRQCPECGKRFTTAETVTITVTKRNGVTEPFNRDKVASAEPGDFAQRVVDETGTDHAVWFVFNPGYQNFDQRCLQLYSALAEKYPGAAGKVTASESFFEADNLIRFGG